MTRSLFRAAAALSCIALFTSSAAAQGDDCTTAVAIGEGVTAVNTTGFVLAGPTPNCAIFSGNEDGWYLYFPSGSGNATASLCGASTLAPGGGVGGQDTFLAVYDASSGCPVGTALACADGAPNCGVNESEATFTVCAGNAYFIQIGDWTGSAPVVGNMAVALAPSAPSGAGDDPSVAIVTGPGIVAVSDAGYTSAGPSPTCFFFGTDASDIWVEYFAATTGIAVVSVCGASTLSPGGGMTGVTDTVLAAYNDPAPGSGCPGTEVACQDGSPQCGFAESEMAFNVSAGSAYYIRLGAWGGGGGVNGNMAITEVLPSPNDDCATAGAAQPEGVYPYSGVGLVSPGPQLGFCSATSSDPSDYWMLYQATTSGLCVISNCPFSTLSPGGSASPNDSYINVMPATSCPPTSLTACADGSPNCGVSESEVTFPVTAGQSFYVQVGTWLGGTPNTGALAITVVAPPVNDECTGAIPVAVGANGPFTNSTATTSIPTGSCGIMGFDLWYSFTATCSGSVILDTCGSPMDTVVSVWDNCPTAAGVEVACDDDAGANGPCAFTLQSWLEVPVIQGNTYYIAVGGFGGQVGSFTLNIKCKYVHKYTSVNNAGDLKLESVDGPANAVEIAAITLDVLHPGLPPAVDFPNGWFFGVPVGFGELQLELLLGPPFLALLDGAGYNLHFAVPNGTTTFLVGAQLYSVGVALDPATGFASIADTTAPTAYLITS